LIGGGGQLNRGGSAVWGPTERGESGMGQLNSPM
jgi:hypothetical protein